MAPTGTPDDGDPADDPAVRSVPLDTADGGTTVIAQQNVGPDNQVGGGEFKNATGKRSVDDAAHEQDELEDTAPIEPDDR